LEAINFFYGNVFLILFVFLSFDGRASLLREVLLKWSPTASTSSRKMEKKSVFQSPAPAQ